MQILSPNRISLPTIFHAQLRTFVAGVRDYDGEFGNETIDDRPDDGNGDGESDNSNDGDTMSTSNASHGETREYAEVGSPPLMAPYLTMSETSVITSRLPSKEAATSYRQLDPSADGPNPVHRIKLEEADVCETKPIGPSWPPQPEIHPKGFFSKCQGWAGPLLAGARGVMVSVAELYAESALNIGGRKTRILYRLLYPPQCPRWAGGVHSSS